VVVHARAANTDARGGAINVTLAKTAGDHSAWVKRIVEVAIVLAALALITVGLGGGFRFHWGPFKIILTGPRNPAIFLGFLVAARTALALGLERIAALLPRAIETGVLLIVALAPFDEWRTIAEITGFALLGLLLLQWALTRKKPVPRSAILWTTVALTAVCFVAAMCSPLRSYSVRTFFRGPGLYCVLFAAGTSYARDERAVRRLLLVGGASLVVVLVAGFVRMIDGTDERFVSLLDYHTKAGLYFTLVLPIVAASLIGARTPRTRAVLAVLLVAGVVAMALTRSRGSWAAAGVSAVVFALLTRRRWWLVGALAVAATIALALAPPEFRARAASIADVPHYLDTGADAPLGNRAFAWRCALEMARERPFLGAGLGVRHFRAEFRRKPYYADAKEDIPHAHDVYLEVLAETGALGLLAFVAALFAMAWTAWWTWRDGADAWARWLGGGALAAIVALGVHGIAEHWFAYFGEVSAPLWALGVVLVGLRSSTCESSPRSQ
jgi:O-antigen ligase